MMGAAHHPHRRSRSERTRIDMQNLFLIATVTSRNDEWLYRRYDAFAGAQ